MVSFDAEPLFPSFPISDCIKVILDKLELDTSLPGRSKLSPSSDICELLYLCLSCTNFVYDSLHHTTKDSGPIGLSLMETISQIWMVHTMDDALKKARDRGLTIPRHVFIYMDDCWCVLRYQPAPRCPGLRSGASCQTDPAEDFNQCLNDVHGRVKFTQEDEVDGQSAFFDVKLTRLDNGVITCIHRKPSNTNIIIKPQSCQNPSIAISFKRELCRAHRFCTSPTQAKKEVTFTLDVFDDNGHDVSA
jgi:hypothetical protein